MTTRNTQAADQALMQAIFGPPTPSDNASQYLTEVMTATFKALSTAEEPARLAQIANTLVAVGHSVGKSTTPNGDDHSYDLQRIAEANVPWQDITQKMVDLNLIAPSEVVGIPTSFEQD